MTSTRCVEVCTVEYIRDGDKEITTDACSAKLIQYAIDLLLICTNMLRNSAWHHAILSLFDKLETATQLIPVKDK